MKLFVYEHITSGALISETLPASLAHEGNAMLTAIVQDLSELEEFEIGILRDQRLAIPAVLQSRSGLMFYMIDTELGYQRHWQQALVEYDAFIIIAPETGQQLQQLQQAVVDKAKILVGCSPSTTEITSDKYLSALQLEVAGLATPKTCLARDWLKQSELLSNNLVIKPRDGAGCLDTMLFTDKLSAQNYLQSLPAEQFNNCIIQDYIDGQAASISLYIDAEQASLLSINSQTIKQSGHQLDFVGCEHGLEHPYFSAVSAQKLANDIVKAFPGLSGFIGVDLVITDTAASIIEINPRLTTAYVGLHQAIKHNPALLMARQLQAFGATL